MTFSSDFSTDFEQQTVEPAPEDPQEAPAEGGPWISHGVIHTGHRPTNH